MDIHIPCGYICLTCIRFLGQKSHYNTKPPQDDDNEAKKDVRIIHLGCKNECSSVTA